ncbi:hypothetical protein MBM_01240 [Drepanopeziza brunnea f. sp. 'multigermtubi' MB_m1]|uniref:Uncharacterized protein n=1 Tax=Marssonina brunnea f. sp. multigermtubi (strain MB_m1) TaxID=1072389 RepID=K1XIK9_MARBU|nr:uncharacterized protein MBM_01240 [Drepanopeziza brunnea f. sp. 'multigermtubi' MB_m1]EKD20558.1 hypothetical protein MBM_01240 [Drepanopeziza brunnea f. sp. 'multigermtubi' MB_m1]
MEDTDLEERYMADYHSGRAWKWLLPRTEEDGPIEYSYATPETRQFVGTDDDAWVYAYNGRDIRAELARKAEEERAASGRGYESDGAAEDLGGDDVRSVTLSLESEAASVSRSVQDYAQSFAEYFQDDEQSTAESVDEDNVRSIAESSDEEDVSSYEEDVSSYEEEISDDEVVARPVLIPQDQESDDESVVAPSSPPYKPARKAPVSAKAKPAGRKSPAPSSQEVSNDGEFYSSIAERRKMMSRGGQSVVKTKRSYVEVEDEDEDEDEDESEPESDESDFESSAHVSKKRKVQPAGKTAPVETPSPAYAPARKTVPAQKSAPLKKAAPARKAAPSRKRKTRGDDDDDSEDDIELDRKASTKKPKTQKGQRKERRETVDSDNIITVDINAVATKEAPKLTEWRNLPGLPDDEDHEAHEGVPGSKWSQYESAALYYCIVDRRNREIDENLGIYSLNLILIQAKMILFADFLSPWIVPLRDTNLYKLMSMNIKYSFGVDRTHTACKMHLNRYIKEDKDYDYQGQGSTGATSSQKRKTESQ